MKAYLIYFTVILFLSLNVSILSQIKSNQNSREKKNNNQIDISGFGDSAHHWYDITDDDKIIFPMPGQKRYGASEVTNIADNILLYQKSNGGWPKNYDMLAILTDEQKNKLKDFVTELNTTFDNGATYSQLEYLAKAFTITKKEKYKAAFIKGINFILSAQYANGGWPQFYPDTSGYRKYITFNDGAMVGIMNLLMDVAENHTYFSFLDKITAEKLKQSINMGIECILRCQIVDNGKLTAWCQQHDNIDFRPQSARTYELPSICNDESCEITLLLMRINNPDKKIIDAVQSSIKWYEVSKIYGIKVNIIPAPKTVYKYSTSTIDKIVIKDEKAAPIWARFYELKTDRPMFSDRDGKLVYSLEEIGRERRGGYRWYTYAPQEVLDKYYSWQKKWGIK